ncbi:uncharacterized protein LOC128237406 [Mya arenaria]|uniref:uncharacterized protein LOC128237406 n=1 Tax=Mya arenaria TaxID=6604 RepID=UPI0022DF2630|nr:uncharacterized protein LOC128237406 [Mya arenaria]
MKIIGFNLFLTTCMYISARVNGDCNTQDQCSCMFDDGSYVYLNSLGNTDETAKFPGVKGSDGSTYSYNPCFPFNGAGNCQGAAACETNTIGDSETIATQQTAQFSQSGDSLAVGYTSGRGILTTTQVNLVCDKSACDASITAQGSTGPNAYTLTLKTVCACPNGCDENGPINCKPGGGGGGIGGGTIFLIILLVIIAVYVIGGVAFQKFVRKAQGKEIIPNYEFWSNTPRYLKSGLTFCLKPCTKKSGKYESI